MEQYKGTKNVDPPINLNWKLKADCRDTDPNIFFPPTSLDKQHKIEEEELAKKICSHCVVSDDCLEYAIRTNQEHGGWGGENETERRSHRSQIIRAFENRRSK